MSAPETRLSSAPNGDTEQALLPAQELAAEISEEKRGIRGAAVIAAIAVGLLFIGWLLFYFDLYLRRGNGG